MPNWDRPLVLCRPKPAGSPDADEFFLYKGRIDSIEKIPENAAPSYEAQSDGGGIYKLHYQSGWLLDFHRLLSGRQRWAVFGKDRKLYVDTGEKTYCLSDGDISVSVRMIGCLVFANVAYAPGGELVRFCIRFPWFRTWFVDGDTRNEECEPFCDIFTELATPDGRARWVERWTSGHAFRSTALTVRSATESQAR
jgi:hypothetical protein